MVSRSEGSVSATTMPESVTDRGTTRYRLATWRGMESRTVLSNRIPAKSTTSAPNCTARAWVTSAGLTHFLTSIRSTTPCPAASASARTSSSWDVVTNPMSANVSTR